jgi:hypothetical protein
MNLNSVAASYIVCDVTVLSETSALVELRWSDGSNLKNIQIVSWAEEKGTLVIEYKTGTSLPTGWNKRVIEGDSYNFPMKIKLVEQGSVKPVFTDISVSSVGYESILNLYYQNVINGYTEGDFRPSNPVQRSEFAKMMALAADYTLQDNLSSTYPDLTNDHWSKKYVMTLSEKGILSGYTSGLFMPTGKITISEVLKVIDYTFTFYEDDHHYPYTVTEDWSSDYFVSLVEAGIILPSDAFYYPYTPKANATRVQCAQLLSRAMEVLHDTTQ